MWSYCSPHEDSLCLFSLPLGFLHNDLWNNNTMLLTPHSLYERKWGKWSHSVVSNSLWPHGLYSLPSSSFHGISQARILEWVAISFSRGSSWPRDGSWISRIAGKTIYHLSHQGSPCLSMKLKVKLLSHIWLFATPWTVAYQVPPSMGFSRQEYWSGLPFPSPVQESEKGKWSRSVVSDS